jgi:hypothetical protein
METLLSKAKEIIQQGADRNINYKTLNDYQTDTLTALAIRETAHPEECIEAVILNKAFYTKLIEALQEQHIADKNILLKEIGEMLLEGAKAHCKEAVEDAIDESFTQLAVMRQFYDDSSIDYWRMVSEDAASRAQDMRLTQQRSA